MAASEATITTTRHGPSLGGLKTILYRTATGTNGEDGVYIDVPLNEVVAAFVNGAEDAKTGPFSAVVSSNNRVTIKALAGTAGDVADIDVLVFGY